MEFLECMRSASAEIIKKARNNSEDIIQRAEESVRKYATDNAVDLKNACLVVVGSVGRLEALEASDLDIVPIFRRKKDLAAYNSHDRAIREKLSEDLQLPVSKGEDLTKTVSIDALVKSESIGGVTDDSGSLTKRILLLTESAHVVGDYPLNDIREEIIKAYGSAERTSGRHALSLCNDIARYY